MREFVAKRIQAVPPSGIRRFFDIAATMDDVISLGIGEPDFVTPGPILQAGMQSLSEGETHYTSNSGIIELREALSKHLQRLYDVSYSPESELLITVGVSEALYLALTAVLDPGDEVIVPAPCFVSYEPEVIFAGGVPITHQLKAEHSFQVIAEELEPLITDKTKAVLIGYPNNPTGAVMTRARLEALAQLAAKHDLLIISDEIYDQLVYGGHQHVCFAGLPGMWEMVGEYDRRRQLFVAGLNGLGLTTFEPRGAFYAFPSIEASGMDDETFAERLLQEEKVAVVPGNAFGADGNHVRCSYATAYEKLEEALERMQRFMQRHG
jgi:aspartate/methionine/tyrosine aminotransferase